MQIRRVAAHYEEIAGHSLIDAINSECHGDTRRAYKAVVRMATDPCFYFARNIYKAMRGLGTDDDCLVRNIIFTSEVSFHAKTRKLILNLSGDWQLSKNAMRRKTAQPFLTILTPTVAVTTRTSSWLLSSNFFSDM